MYVNVSRALTLAAKIEGLFALRGFCPTTVMHIRNNHLIYQMYIIIDQRTELF